MQFVRRTSTTAAKFPHHYVLVFTTIYVSPSTLSCFPVTLTFPDVSHAPVACRVRPCLDLPNPKPLTDTIMQALTRCGYGGDGCYEVS